MMFCSLFCIYKKENDREINKWYNEEKIGRQIEICVGGGEYSWEKSFCLCSILFLHLF